LNEARTYTVNELQSILVNLDNEIPEPQKERMARAKIPIPKEYGGGWATGATQEEAVRHLIERIRDQIRPESETVTFQDCYERWIEIKKGQEKSPCTIANYERQARVRLLPFFGDRPIDSITPDDVQLYFNSIIHLSKSYSIQSRAVLRGIFSRAERNGLIDKNPMRFEYERSKKVKGKVVLQDDDLVNVIKELELLSDGDYLYSCLLCFTALRRGEILGLRWEDLDFEKRQISVERNVIFPDGCNDPIVKEPKDGSFGVVHFHSELLKRIEPYRLPAGFVVSGSRSDNLSPMTRSSFDKMWYRIKKTLNLQGATSHSFRASYASMMNAHCIHIDPKALQGALRHKTPDLAIKIYTKENKNKTREAEIEYDEYLCGALEHDSEHGRVG
jgi:integrase